jgi:hypothetical protein
MERLITQLLAKKAEQRPQQVKVISDLFEVAVATAENAQKFRLAYLVAPLVVLLALAFFLFTYRMRPTAKAHTVPTASPTVSRLSSEQALVSWWPGDGNARDKLGQNHGQLLHGAKYEEGKIGKAFSFDGKESFFTAPTINLPHGNQARTLEFWVNVRSLLSQEGILAAYGDYETYFESFILGIFANHTLFFSNLGWSFDGPRIKLNRWYHIAVTCSNATPTNLLIVYVDGKEVSRGSGFINTKENAQFYLGHAPGRMGKLRKLDGLIDEVKVYNRALTPEEIRSHLN